MSYIKIHDHGSVIERKIFYKDKQCTIIHREDGPAIEYKNGTKIWYKDDKCHRENGPAVEYNDGAKSFYLNGYYYYEEEYWIMVRFGGFA